MVSMSRGPLLPSPLKSWVLVSGGRHSSEWRRNARPRPSRQNPCSGADLNQDRLLRAPATHDSHP
jgi:hypothetical protein